MFRKLRRYLSDPYFALGCDLIHKHPNWMSDEFFIRTEFRIVMGYKLDLKNPKTFNEKLQWLKLYDRNPLYTTLVDKVKVKEWVAKKIGEKYILPTLAIWERAEDIDISQLPNEFVLKCNHDSGSVIICKDKSKFDLVAAKEKLGNALQYNWYLEHREWAYKNVKPCIYAEPYVVDEKTGDLPDYKFFNFEGEPRMIQVDFDRFTNHKRNLYDTAWNFLEASIKYPFDRNRVFDKPTVLDELLNLSRKLSKGIKHVRTDFYLINDHIYFGEMTFYHGAGYDSFSSNELRECMGEWILLPTR